MKDITPSKSVEIDFGALGRDKDASALDGHIAVYEGENKHLIAVVTLSPKILVHDLSRLDRALCDGFAKRSSYFAIHHESKPGAPYFIVFKIPELAMEAELDLLIEYLHQSGVSKNPIVCDMRWISLKNKKRAPKKHAAR